jgi:hypothetical protein
MAKQRKIIVHGEPRADLDPAALLQLLLTIDTEDPARSPAPQSSPDVFEAAVEDRRRPERTR